MSKPKFNADFQPAHSWDSMFFGATYEAGVLTSVNSGFRTFHPEFDHESCIHCQLCWIYCPEGCIDRSNGDMQVDMDYCKGCGICAAECPKKCIKMVRDGESE